VFSQILIPFSLLLTLFSFRLRSFIRQFDLAVRLTQWNQRRTLSALVRSRPLSVAERHSRLDCVLGCCSALVRCSTAYQHNTSRAGMFFSFLFLFYLANVYFRSTTTTAMMGATATASSTLAPPNIETAIAGTAAEVAAGMFFFVSFSFYYTNVYFRFTTATAMMGTTTDNHSIINNPFASPMHATSSIIYNPPTPKSLPPYKSPSLVPGHIRHQKPHSRQKTFRAFRIFPYCQWLPSKNVDCAHFRRAWKLGSRLDAVTPTPIALTARFIAIKDIITAAKTVHRAQMDKLQSKLGALTDGVEAVCPVLVTNSFSLPSTFRVPTFMPHSLAPDKSYPDNR
jgi:hypothetical protein